MVIILRALSGYRELRLTELYVIVLFHTSFHRSRLEVRSACSTFASLHKQIGWEQHQLSVKFSSKMDEYEVEEKKQAAARTLLNYSHFVMTCIGEDVKPGQLRLHLMKEISGMPTTFKPQRSFEGDTPVGDKGQTSSPSASGS
ncbi:hypothetical protein R1flu_002352 [Riccia fluitans]|uniref:Uncharacterized protein n=1 Tax=Riccia fluitans TaxID=41844 RepID=A0ABD1Y8T8_9MARC